MLTTLTYFTIRIQICVRCYSSGLILVCQLFVLHLLNVFCVFWVVALCSQLLCLCLRCCCCCCCCARVVALVCSRRLQSYVFLFSDLFVFSYYLLFVLFVLLVRLLLHMFINACLYLVLYANTCHVISFVYVCVRVIVFRCLFYSYCLCYKLFCVFLCCPQGAHVMSEALWCLPQSAERPPKLMHLPSVCLKAVELWL